MVAAPFMERSYQTPNFLADRLLHLLSGDEWKVLTYAIRHTFGFNRPKARISLSQFAHGKDGADGTALDRGTGLSEPTVLKALRALNSFGVVRQTAPNNRRNEGAQYEVCLEDSCVNFEALDERIRVARSAARDKMQVVRSAALNGIERPMALGNPLNAINRPPSMPLTTPVNVIETQNPVLKPDSKPALDTEESAAMLAALSAAIPAEEEDELTQEQEYALPADDLTPSPDDPNAPTLPVPAALPAPTRVVNIRDAGVREALKAGDSGYVYCGRALPREGLAASKWGNPFPVEKDKDTAENRREALRKFEEHLRGNADLIAALPELRGKTLVCWCKPNICHCDVLAAWADGLGDNAAPAPEGHRSVYASMQGKTAHWVSVQTEHQTLCGQPSTYFLSTPKTGRRYQLCTACESAWQPPAATTWNIGDAAYYLHTERRGWNETHAVPVVIIGLTAQRVKIVPKRADGTGDKPMLVAANKLKPRSRQGEPEAWETEALVQIAPPVTSDKQPQSALTKAMFEAIPEDIRPATCHYGKNDEAAKAVMKAGWTPDQVALFVAWLYAENEWYRRGDDGTPVIISMTAVGNKIKACWNLVERWHAKRQQAHAASETPPKPESPFDYANRRLREQREQRDRKKGG